jgi:hypothetical protein
VRPNLHQQLPKVVITFSVVSDSARNLQGGICLLMQRARLLATHLFQAFQCQEIS